MMLIGPRNDVWLGSMISKGLCVVVCTQDPAATAQCFSLYRLPNLNSITQMCLNETQASMVGRSGIATLPEESTPKWCYTEINCQFNTAKSTEILSNFFTKFYLL